MSIDYPKLVAGLRLVADALDGNPNEEQASVEPQQAVEPSNVVPLQQQTAGPVYDEAPTLFEEQDAQAEQTAQAAQPAGPTYEELGTLANDVWQLSGDDALTANIMAQFDGATSVRGILAAGHGLAFERALYAQKDALQGGAA